MITFMFNLDWTVPTILHLLDARINYIPGSILCSHIAQCDPTSSHLFVGVSTNEFQEKLQKIEAKQDHAETCHKQVYIQRYV